MKLFIICAVLFFGLFGCTEREVYENQTRLDECKDSLETAQQAVQTARQNASYAEIERLECERERLICIDELIECNNTPYLVIYVNCTNSTGKAIFTAKEMPSDNDFLTKYPCFWTTAANYGFGRYYDVASVAQSPYYSFLDVKECYWSIQEFTGQRLATGTPGYGGG